MATYHLNAKIISRGKGQSAIAAAAYRSGERLVDEQTGEVKHYTARAERILFTDIMAPKDAPEWAHDRNQLWNHAERAEKRKDAQLAREIEVSLPHELTEEQREYLVKDFAREQFVRKGYVVDIAIHAPDKDSDDRNFHAHLMVTRRTIGPDGFAKTKDWQLNKDQLATWREDWAKLANRHLERHGHAARIDHRSLKDQGIDPRDREPTVHLGYAANEMAQRGAQSDRMDALKGVLDRNEIRVDIKALDAELAALERVQRAAQKAPERPLGAAAGDIRLAWALTDSGQGFADALEDRGHILARVNADEARASARSALFAKALGRFAPALKPDELVVVHASGGLNRLDPRTLGDDRAAIEKRLGTVDRASLLTLTDARAVMQEARRAQFIDEKRTARPRGEIENRVWSAFHGSKSGAEFAGQLEKNGLTLARVTEADLTGLAALRAAEERAAQERPGTKARYIPAVELGEVVAVSRRGGIHRLDPNQLSPDAMMQRLAEMQARPPSVVEVRTAQEIERERQATLRGWARDERALARTEQDAAADRKRASVASQRRRRDAAAQGRQAVQGFARVSGKALKGAAKVASSFLELVASVATAPIDAKTPPQKPQPERTRAPEPKRAPQETPHEQSVRANEDERSKLRQALLRQAGQDLSRSLGDEHDHSQGRERER